MQPPEDLETLVGQTLMVKFLEVDEEQERVVFSARRAHSETFTSGFKVWRFPQDWAWKPHCCGAACSCCWAKCCVVACFCLVQSAARCCRFETSW
jgi:hypothetical protein